MVTYSLWSLIFSGIPGENNLLLNQILCKPTELARVLGRPFHNGGQNTKVRIETSSQWIMVTLNEWKYAKNFRPIGHREPVALDRFCLGTDFTISLCMYFAAGAAWLRSKPNANPVYIPVNILH